MSIEDEEGYISQCPVKQDRQQELEKSHRRLAFVGEMVQGPLFGSEEVSVEVEGCLEYQLDSLD